GGRVRPVRPGRPGSGRLAPGAGGQRGVRPAARPGLRARHGRPRLRPDHLRGLRHRLGPPAADLLPYVTSKGALVALARALAVAHGPDGIAVTCVAPGLTDTPAARAGLPAAAFDAVRARQALPRTL